MAFPPRLKFQIFISRLIKLNTHSAVVKSIFLRLINISMIKSFDNITLFLAESAKRSKQFEERNIDEKS